MPVLYIPFLMGILGHVAAGSY
uniref:Uncharacterized protein n=1 Tax=Arundo donax TaxID=35708 RepID=A0A0A9ADI3_ARUDO